MRRWFYACYDRLICVRALYLYGGTLLFFVMLGLFWFFFIYRSLERYIAHQEQLCKEFCNNHFKQVSTECSSRQLEKRLAQQRNAFDAKAYGMRSILHKKQQTFLCNEAERYGLVLKSYTILSPVDKGWYDSIRMQCELCGPLINIEQFLSAIKQSDLMLNCKDVHLTRYDDNSFLLSCGFKALLPKEFVQK